MAERCGSAIVLWQRLSLLLDELLDLQADEQAARLARIEDESPALAAMARTALKADAGTLPLLDRPLKLSLQEGEDASEAADNCRLDRGDMVGPWRLQRELGHGGMGRVWLAERDDGQYRLEVAVKLIDGLTNSALVREQLRRERQILADLDHPGIARLLDGGILDNGTPWFAMEYVHGETLDRYCRRHDLSLAQRLTLLARIARIVQYAHAHLVVHRDLKPGNIMVDEAGTPHLLDFGIAKLLDAGSGSGQGTPTLLSAATPEYAAPEQLRGETVGTAADIYALGMIGWEMIVGQRPPRGAGQPAGRVEAGLLPSSALCGHGRLRNAVRGDIDCIVTRAMAPLPQDRYVSAQALADDLERYLQGHAVEARGAGSGYRARRFVSRHWLGVSLSMALVLALAGGLAGTLWQFRQARSEAARAAATRDFLVGLFQANDPDNRQGRELTAAELLDAGRRSLNDGDYASPIVANDMRCTIASLYLTLGRFAQAEPMLDKCLAEARSLHGDQASETLNAELRMADLDYQLARYDQAASRQQEVIAILRTQGRQSQPIYARALQRLAATFNDQGRYPQALALYKQADAAYSSIYGKQACQRGHALDGMADVAQATARFAEGLKDIEQALVLLKGQACAASLHFSLLFRKASLLRDSDRFDQAAEVLRTLLKLELARYAPGHPMIANTQHDLATLLRSQGHLHQAETLFRSALSTFRANLGEDNDATATGWFDLGRTLADENKLDQAADAFARAEAAYRKSLGANHQFVAMSKMLRSSVLLRKGHADEALPLAREAVDIYAAALPPDNPLIANARLTVARALLARGEARQAADMTAAVVANFERHLGEHDSRTASARLLQARCLIRLGRVGPATVLLKAAISDFEASSASAGNLQAARKLLASLDVAARDPAVDATNASDIEVSD